MDICEGGALLEHCDKDIKSLLSKKTKTRDTKSYDSRSKNWVVSWGSTYWNKKNYYDGAPYPF